MSEQNHVLMLNHSLDTNSIYISTFTLTFYAFINVLVIMMCFVKILYQLIHLFLYFRLKYHLSYTT